MTIDRSPTAKLDADTFAAAFVNGLRVLIVAGVPTGVLIVGVGSRLAMLVLRFTSPSYAVGATSDDGFEIGRFTVGGTYNLMMLGAAVGIIGAAAVQWVMPWLIGPTWFRRLTVALAAGAVVGSMVVHADGVDFRLLEPTWLAVALFVALPALFAVAIFVAVERARAASPATIKRWKWLPLALVFAFPATLLLMPVACIILALWIQIRRTGGIDSAAESMALRLSVRTLWLAIAVVGLLALLGDISDLQAI